VPSASQRAQAETTLFQCAGPAATPEGPFHLANTIRPSLEMSPFPGKPVCPTRLYDVSSQQYGAMFRCSHGYSLCHLTVPVAIVPRRNMYFATAGSRLNVFLLTLLNIKIYHIPLPF
jgi:hypothetical protein